MPEREIIEAIMQYHETTRWAHRPEFVEALRIVLNCLPSSSATPVVIHPVQRHQWLMDTFAAMFNFHHVCALAAHATNRFVNHPTIGSKIDMSRTFFEPFYQKMHSDWAGELIETVKWLDHMHRSQSPKPMMTFISTPMGKSPFWDFFKTAFLRHIDPHEPKKMKPQAAF